MHYIQPLSAQNWKPTEKNYTRNRHISNLPVLSILGKSLNKYDFYPLNRKQLACSSLITKSVHLQIIMPFK